MSRCAYDSCDFFVEFFHAAWCINSTLLVVPSPGQGDHKSLHGSCGSTTSASTTFVSTLGKQNPVTDDSASLTYTDGALPS